MKRAWILLLAVLFAAGCGGSDSTPASQGPPVEPPPPTTPPPPPDQAPPEFPPIALEQVATGFVQPVDLTSAGDGSGRLFVVERRGVILQVAADEGTGSPFLDLTARISSASNEQGLLGLSFSPAFASDRQFYVNYTDLDGDTVVARFTVNADGAADVGSEQVLLRIAQPFANHNGGQIKFGPDGYLYVASGDGGGGGDPQGHGQDRTTLLGAILRIDVDGGTSAYAIPSTNPYGDEIWAYGLRNPWRFSFDSATGDLYIADVGQSMIEEINFQPADSPGGENYGWNVMEGTACFSTPNCNAGESGFTLPVFEYENAQGNCSVTGGYVSRGAAQPRLQGVYVYGDFCSGRIWGLARIDGAWQNALLLDSPHMIATFGEGDAGDLYIAGYTNGIIYRIVVDG